MAGDDKVVRIVFTLEGGRQFRADVTEAIAAVITGATSIENAEVKITNARIQGAAKRKQAIDQETAAIKTSANEQLAAANKMSTAFSGPATERVITFASTLNRQLNTIESRLNQFSRAIINAQGDVDKLTDIVGKAAPGSEQAARATTLLVQAYQRLADAQDKATLSGATSNDNISALDQSARALRDQIDPLSTAQRNYSQSISTADQLLAKHRITTLEYAEAVRLAKFSFEGTAASIRKEAEAAYRDLLIASERLKTASAKATISPTATSSLTTADTLSTQLKEKIVSGQKVDPITLESTRQLKEEINKLAFDYERLSNVADAYKQKLNPLIDAEAKYRARIEEVNQLTKAKLITDKEAQAILGDFVQKHTIVSAALQKSNIEQLNTQQITKQFKPILQQANKDFVDFNSTMTRSFGLNRIGLLELQAAGINTFQSLAAGISPFRTAITEGAQVVGAFIQGTNLGFKQFVSYAIPIAAVTTALIGVTAAIAGAAARAQSIRELNVALDQFHRGTSITGKDLEDVAKTFRQSGESASTLNTILAEIARNPTLDPAFSKQIIETARNIGAAFGVNLEEGFKKLTTALDGGAKGIIDLGTSLGVLTPKQISEVLELNRTVGAQAAVKKGYEDIVSSLHPYTDTLSPIASLNREIRATWNSFIEALEKSAPIQAALSLVNKLTESLSDLNKELDKGKKEEKSSFGHAVTGALAGAFTGAVIGATVTSPGVLTTIPGVIGGMAIGGVAGAVGGYKYGNAYTDWRTSTANQGSVVTTVPPIGGGGNAASTAATFLGTSATDTNLRQFVQKASNLDPATTEWCAAFANAVLAKQGISGTGSNIATSFLKAGVGVSTSDVTAGDIAVESRGRSAGQTGGHVGFATGVSRTSTTGEAQIQIISGNTTGNKVGTTFVNANEVSLRRLTEPSGGTIGPTVEQSRDLAKARGEADDKLREQGELFQKQIPLLQLYGSTQEAELARLRATTDVFKDTGDSALAAAAGQQAYNEVIKKQEIDLAKQADTQKLTNELTLETAKLTSQDEVTGLRAAALAAATLANKQEPLVSIQQKYNELLVTGAVSAIDAAAKAVPALVEQAAASERLAAAASKGAAAEHEASLENQAVAASHDALTKAIATGNKALIEEAEKLETTNLLLIRRNDLAQQSTDASRAIQANKDQSEVIALQISLQGRTTEEITKQTALLQLRQQLGGKYNELSGELKQDWIDTTTQVQNYNIALVQAQRNQERINSLITSLADTITSSLTTAIEDAFDQKKVTNWGDKINSVLKDVIKQASEQLFIKPVLGSLADTLGFSSAASSLGTITGATSSGTSTTKTTESGIGGSAATGAIGLGASVGSKSTSSVLDYLNTEIGPALGFAKPATSTTSDLGTDFSSAESGVFGTTSTLTEGLGGAATGLGAGATTSSLLGGNTKVGSVGGLFGGLVGSLSGIPGGSFIGGAIGGLTGLFGNNKPSNDPGAATIDLVTGRISGRATSKTAASNQDVSDITAAVKSFARTFATDTGVKTDVSLAVQSGVRDGIKVSYGGALSGLGEKKFTSAQDAIDQVELDLAHNLTGISGTLKTVLDSVSDPKDISDAITFAEKYDNLKKAADSAFSSIEKDTDKIGPYATAYKDLTDEFDKLTISAEQFGLSLDPINKGLDEAKTRLKTDFKDSLDAALDAASSKDYINTLKDVSAAYKSNIREAKAIGLDTDTDVALKTSKLEIDKLRETLDTLTVKELNNVYEKLKISNPEVAALAVSIINTGTAATDAAASITTLATGLKDITDITKSLRTGKLSGQTDVAATTTAIKQYQRDLDAAKAAGENVTGTLLASLATSSEAAINASLTAYGNAPKTADLRRQIIKDLDAIYSVANASSEALGNVPASVATEQTKIRTDTLAAAGGSMGTAPGKILVGEMGPEWMLPAYARGTGGWGWRQVGKHGPEVIDQPGGAVILPFPMKPRMGMPSYADGTDDIATIPVPTGFVSTDSTDANIYRPDTTGNIVTEIRALFRENRAMREELVAIKKQVQGGQIQANTDARAGNSRLSSIDAKLGTGAVTPARRTVG